MASRKTHDQYRHAGTGRFISEQEAKRLPKDEVVKERVPNPGYGDTKGEK
jgi:hypothetical protein